MSFIAVSAGIGAASLGYSVVKGISQGAEAKRINASNPRPTYQIPDEYKQNVLMSQNMARIGLPSQQYNNQRNAINQNQAGAIGAVQNSANPGANIAAIVRQGDQATGNLNAQDAMARQQNQRYAIGQNAQLGQQKLAAQQYNNFDKYTEQFNKAAALQGAENQNIQNGVNGASQLAGSLYGAKQFGNYINPYAGQTIGQRYNLPGDLGASSAGIQGLGLSYTPLPGT